MHYSADTMEKSIHCGSEQDWRVDVSSVRLPFPSRRLLVLCSFQTNIVTQNQHDRPGFHTAATHGEDSICCGNEMI